jgi:hypothetical protein
MYLPLSCPRSCVSFPTCILMILCLFFFIMKSYQILFLAVAISSTTAASSSLCFYPDGITTDPNHVPCNSTISTSACCDPLDSCTDSGICLGRTGFNYRGSCTDKTWTSSNCASECLAGEGRLQKQQPKTLTFSPQILSTKLPTIHSQLCFPAV